jgi:ABC-type transport system involved in cytochrome c biogenesis permease component
MNSFPVILRELRAESRHPINYGLRVSGAAVLMLACLIIWSGQQRLSIGDGARLFSGLNATMLVGIWLFAPLLSADCISGEKREGTLGLLFLTPLKARDIVLAKMMTHALRALTLVAAAVPVLIIPVLLGGVSGLDALRAVLLDLGALILALSAGVLASALSREWLRAMLAALFLSFSSAFLVVSVHAFFRVSQVLSLARLPNRPDYFFALFWEYIWSRWGRIPFWRQATFAGSNRWNLGVSSADSMAVWLAGGLLAVALLAAGLVILVAARRIHLTWQEQTLSRRQQWLLKTFCTPRFWQSMFRRKMRASLERNPIGWLQQRTWSARLTKWGWLLVMVIVECVVLVDYSSYTTLRWQSWLVNALAMGMAFSAVGSFRLERQSGALELLLVTPMTAQQIIRGRLLGIWWQFLPVVAFLLIYNWLLLEDFGSRRGPVYTTNVSFYLGAYTIGLAVKYFSMPLIGLYFSMRRMNFIAAWLLACVTGLLLPVALGLPLGILFGLGLGVFVWAGYLIRLVWYVFLGLLAYHALMRILTRRTFILV